MPDRNGVQSLQVFNKQFLACFVEHAEGRKTIIPSIVVGDGDDGCAVGLFIEQGTRREFFLLCVKYESTVIEMGQNGRSVSWSEQGDATIVERHDLFTVCLFIGDMFQRPWRCRTSAKVCETALCQSDSRAAVDENIAFEKFFDVIIGKYVDLQARKCDSISRLLGEIDRQAHAAERLMPAADCRAGRIVENRLGRHGNADAAPLRLHGVNGLQLVGYASQCFPVSLAGVRFE